VKASTTDDEKVRGLIPDARWVRDAKGKVKLVEDEVDPQTWASRRREPAGWWRGAKVSR
jgi:hypothetical protein